MAVPISARSAGARRRLRRRLPAVLLATILGTLLLMVAGTIAAGPAQAAAFRYWGYFSWQAGKWEFSQVGADQTKPADGGVEGWRFAISPAEGSPRVPRTTGDFSAICGSTPVVGGKKRVAVVIDYGVPAEAPKGETPPPARGACAVVAPTASGVQVLQAVAPLRAQKGLVCAIDGFPRTECGAPYDGPLPKSTASEAPVQLRLAGQSSGTAKTSNANSDNGFPVGIAVAAVLVVGLGAATLVVARRRRSPSK